MTVRPTLSIIVPVRNEAGNIAPLIGEIHAALVGHPMTAYEIIYVDDASDDGTAAELAAAATDSRVRVFTHTARCGQSQATITGVAAATAPWIATIDGDGQNDPADLNRLLAARDQAGPESERTLFIGRRGGRRDSLARTLASRLANGVRRALLGDEATDSGCGLKLIPRALFLQLPRFDALHRFMPALVLRAGGRVVPVPIGHRQRLRGTSKYGIIGRGLVGLVDLIGVVWLLSRHTQPALKNEGTDA